MDEWLDYLFEEDEPTQDFERCLILEEDKEGA